MPSPRLEIHYCTQCRWLLRAGWMAQELLTTFSDGELAEVALIPSRGGLFRILLDGEQLWDRKEEDGFPDIKTIKQRVRDRLFPDRPLGHSDRPGKTEAD